MKPNFALDLSHDGISLLHRDKGGWTLVGEVALDDPAMPTRLDQLRRTAAELESGGFTTKLIIPNSQVLYTTVEAPGPDDIAREVQIRAGLDGVTPYAVGDLVFDWRAEGEQARVAVLARETMDEAETFAAEYQFNPVSFVARPNGNEFSGEPFFGLTHIATRLIDPSERLVPDASPVPRRRRKASGPETAAAEGEEAAAAPPAQDPAGADETDPFGMLDRPDAAASDEAPAPARKRKPAKRRKPRAAAEAGPPPELAPFPPTPDETDEGITVPRPVARGGKSRSLPPAPPPLAAGEAGPGAVDDAPGRLTLGTAEGTAAVPQEAAEEPADPPVAFASRRVSEPDATPTGSSATSTAPSPPKPDSSATARRVDLEPPPLSFGDSPAERRRAEMAAALSKPLPRPDMEAPPEQSRPAAPVSGGLRAALGGLVRRVRGKTDGPTGQLAQSVAAEARRGALTPVTEAESEAEAEQESADMPPAPPVTAPVAAPISALGPPPSELAAASRPASAIPPAPAPISSSAGNGTAPAKRSRKARKDDRRAREAEALTVFGARRAQEARSGPRYLGLILVLVLLLLMAAVAVWSTLFLGSNDAQLFNPAPATDTASATSDTAAAPDVTTETIPQAPPAETATAQTDIPDETLPPEPAAGEVLTSEAAQARYAATGVWQRAPEPLAAPESARVGGVDIARIAALEIPQNGSALPKAGTAVSDTPPAGSLAPPPPGTKFDLDANGLVRATPDGAVSPAGFLVYAGKPPVVPPPRPGTPASDAAATDTTATATTDATATDTTASAPDAPVQLPGVPATRPPPRPAGLVPDNAGIDAAANTAVASAAADAAIETAVDAAMADAFADASELAVPVSRVPTHRPDGFSAIVDKELASASDGSAVVNAVASPSEAVTPAIPTSANVARAATTKNQLDLHRINLIGIYGTSNARRALVRLSNGRYVKVEVGDRLDGGRVTSISGSRLTYQKGSRTYALDVLPLG